MHPAALPIAQLLPFVAFTTSRGSGPGGQHRNKTETMVHVTHRPTGIAAKAGERRSLEENRSRAVHRLRIELALRHREPLGGRLVPPGVYAPSELWRSRTREGAIVVSPKHADLAALLAEALDVLAHFGDDAPRAARALGVSGSQLVKLLSLEPAALAAFNQRRRETGRRALR